MGTNGGSPSASSSIHQSTHLRNALNALLYQTGTPSCSFMMVLATNRPQDLDAAMLDRIDVSLQIGLPQSSQRQALIRLYMQVHVTESVRRAMQSSFSLFLERFSSFFSRQKSRRITSAFDDVGMLDAELKTFIDEECLTNDAMEELLSLTKGFSGREISKLFISVQYVLLFGWQRFLGYLE